MNFGYTSRMSANRLRRWSFALKSLRARLSFRAGRASFVECLIARTDAEMTPTSDPSGRALAPRLLARHALTCRPPRAGSAGWKLYEERLLEPGPHAFARLDCAHCGHEFVIQVQAPGAASLPAPTAWYRSDWFRFAASAYDAPASLNCPRCETLDAPRLTFLHEP